MNSGTEVSREGVISLLGKTHTKSVFLVVEPIRSGYPLPLDFSGSYLFRPFFPFYEKNT